MVPFELAEPASLSAAIALLDPDDAAVRPIAGGTALMLMMKAGVYEPRKLVSLRRIAANYAAITAAPDGLRIGAMTTLAALERSADVSRHAPVIGDALPRLSNVRVRNVATVGGALAHGDPHMDLPPVLMALGAIATVVGPSGERRIAVEDLYSGYYETVLQRNELISEVYVPTQGAKKAAYLKVTTGSADDWPALGLAAVVDCDGPTIKSARLVVGAATAKVTRLKSAEAVLAGKPISDGLLREAGAAACGEVELISDGRGSAPYKRELLRVYLRRAVSAAVADRGAH